jgi:hypothetical protein
VFVSVLLGQDEAIALLLLDIQVKRAIQTAEDLMGHGPLAVSGTKGTGHHPAKTPSLATFVYTIMIIRYGCRANAKFRHLVPAGLAATFHIFPAVLSMFSHNDRLI